MPDPEETEREAVLDAVNSWARDVYGEADKAPLIRVLRDRVLAARRLSESEIRRETVEQVATWLEGFDWGGSWDWADATASEVPAFIRTYWPKEKN